MDRQTRSADRIEGEAGDWLARRLSGRWTPADQVAFDTWYEDIGNRVAYVRLEAAWQRAGRLTALGAGVPQGVVPPRLSWGDARFPGGAQSDGATSTQSARNPWPRLAAAAVVLLALAATLSVYLSSRPAGDRYSTPVGGLDDVRLVDGSRITLNTDTRIRVRLSKTERRIDLDQGEAFFQVTHDPARPFVVYAGDKRVIDLGTQFSVRRESNDVEVVVTDGQVQLTEAETSAGSAAPPVTLRAGSVAKTQKAAVLVHAESALETEKHLSWRSGYVVFKDTTLEQAVNTFNRYNTRKLVIGDPQIAQIRIGGNFRSTNIDAFLSLLKDGFPITVEQKGNEAILTGR